MPEPHQPRQPAGRVRAALHRKVVAALQAAERLAQEQVAVADEAAARS